MKNLYIIFLLFFVISSLTAQQEEQFSQFMYNKLAFNPAYAGSKDGACFTAVTRSQWIGGPKGTPQSQLLTFSMPLFGRKVGLGATINHHTIGLTERLTVETAYAYRIRMPRGYLSFGLQGSVRLIRINFSDAVTTQPKDSDGAIPGDLQSKYIPNFGAGLYYHNTRFFIGASAPRLLHNSIDLAEDDVVITRELSHVYVTGGMRWDLNANLQFQPQVLLKYVKNDPFEGDAHANFIFANKFTAGISYRLGGSKRSGIGEAIGLIGGIQATDMLFIGMSYDYTLSEIRYTTGGSIEAVVRYCIGGQSDDAAEFVSPRFF
ncbi:MAG: type IX secretion system membrane protein PorP/SprF [Sinomicrobium sp.]|nr:type IX secretion system membrane protein PorP/SprF [Sinomicrobium sp.]